MRHDIDPRGTLPSIKVELDDETTFELPDEAVVLLAGIALRNQIGYGTAIEQAVRNQNFIDEQFAKGGKLMIKHRSGVIHNLEYR